MSEASIPAPKRHLLSFFATAVDAIVMGLGTDAVIAAATAEAPWLDYPIIKELFRWLVENYLTGWVNETIRRNGGNLIIRLTGDYNKAAVDASREEFKNVLDNPEATYDEKRAAFEKLKADAKRLIRRTDS